MTKTIKREHRLRDTDKFCDDFDIWQIGIHPMCAAFPSLNSKTLADLKADIEANGCAHPIIVWKNPHGLWLILDGAHRRQICRELGIEPAVKVYSGTPAESARHAFSLNDARRHWETKGQKQLAAAALANMIRDSSEGNSSDTEPNGSAGRARDISSDQTGVPARTVQRGQAVLDDGSKVLQNAVKDDVVTVSDAAAIVAEPKATQTKAVQMVAAGEAPTAQAAVDQINASHANGKPRKKRALKPPASGRVTFDWRKMLDCYGKLVRHIDACGISYGCKETGKHKESMELLSKLNATLTRWQLEVT